MPYRTDEIDEPAVFREGLELFNDGQWFDAHEAWEDVWHLASGDRKRFYQGLIQCAVTLEHMRRGNPRGVVTVFDSARSKFVGLANPYLGVDWRRLLEQIDAMVAPIRGLPAPMFEPRAGRGLDLPVDLAKAPRIELLQDPFR